jgi:predicted amidohydrolase
MSRTFKIGAAQSGPIQLADSKETAVKRLVEMMKQAASEGCDLVVFTELALTTFFPRYFAEDRAEMDKYFETEMPGPITQPLFDMAREKRIGFYLGYGEITPDGLHYNTAIIVDKSANIVGKYRKVHLPGHVEFDSERTHQHLEKRYFLPGDLGFKAWRTMNGLMGMAICNDRRWPETYRVMGLQGVEVVMLGYNTPSVNSQDNSEGPEIRKFHSRLSMQAGAYQNSTYVVGVAKAGKEDGFPLFGDSCIVDPNGQVVAKTKTEEDELITAECDLDLCTFGKETIFNFANHRRVEHYSLITNQTGVIAPD